MWRAEYGFLGSRQQFMTGLQYRFGLSIHLFTTDMNSE